MGGGQSVQSFNSEVPILGLTPQVTFPTMEQWTLHQNILPLQETSDTIYTGIALAQTSLEQIPQIAPFISTIFSIITLLMNKDDTMSKLQSLDRKIDLVEISAALNLAEAKLFSVKQALQSVLSNDNNLLNRKVDILIALRGMDELNSLFTNQRYAFWKYPIASASHFVIYVTLHRTVCKLAVQLLKSDRIYQRQCDATYASLNQQILLFSNHYLSQRISDSIIYSSSSGDKISTTRHGAYEATGANNGVTSYVIVDVYNFIPDKPLGFYEFKKQTTRSYQSNLRALYQSFFMGIYDHPKTKNGERSINSQCFFENPLYSRIECGFPGITKEACESKRCCFDRRVVGVKWCFKSGNRNVDWRSGDSTERTQPLVRRCWFGGVYNRNDCGFRGITKAQCEKKGCCYDPRYSTQNINRGNIYHCFHNSRDTDILIIDEKFSNHQLSVLDLYHKLKE